MLSDHCDLCLIKSVALLLDGKFLQMFVSHSVNVWAGTVLCWLAREGIWWLQTERVSEAEHAAQSTAEDSAGALELIASVLEGKPECVCNVRTEPLIVECGRQLPAEFGTDLLWTCWRVCAFVGFVSLLLGFWLGRVSPFARGQVEFYHSPPGGPVRIDVRSLEAARRRARAISQ